MVAVLPAQLADLERIAAIHYDAFRPSAISRRIFADVKRDDQCAKTVARLTKRLDDPTSALFKAVVDDLIVGFALWEVPKKAGDPEPDKDDEQKGPDRWPAGTNVALAESFFARLDLGIKTPHYRASLYLPSLAREPLLTFCTPCRLEPTRDRPGAAPVGSRVGALAVGQQEGRRRGRRVLPRGDRACVLSLPHAHDVLKQR